MNVTNIVFSVLCCLLPYCAILAIVLIFTIKRRLKSSGQISKNLASENNNPLVKNQITWLIIISLLLLTGLLFAAILGIAYLLFPSILTIDIRMLVLSLFLVGIVGGLILMIVSNKIIK